MVEAGVVRVVAGEVIEVNQFGSKAFLVELADGGEASLALSASGHAHAIPKP